jgi:signal transduction histidine kinase
MPRGRRLGLRWRLTAALTFVSGLTLVVATLVLLLPLDRRLRSDALDTLAQTALAARQSFGELPARDIRPGSRALEETAASLRRRTRAEVIVADASGAVLVATDPDDAAQRFTVATRALRERIVVRDVVGSGEGALAEAAAPVRTEHGSFVLIVRRPLVAVTGTTDVVERGLILAAIIGMALAVATGILLARRLVRRLDALRDTALRFGDFTAGAEVLADTSTDEVGDLTRAFATMQRQLREQEQARRTFVATASHELRTPLTSLRLMLGMLSEQLQADDPDLDDARSQAARAQRQTERLGQLAGSLLDLSRLDAGLPARHELLALDDTCRAVVAEFGPRAQASGNRLALATPEQRCWAIADPGSVAQVVRILLDNALRHSPRGADVLVEVALHDGIPAVSVSDAGPGLEPEDRERIFKRFERGRETAGDSGFGLGLAIGRELALRMDGDLRLDAADAGARFVLTLVAAPAEELEAP